jgi:hypothetical protein
VWTLLSSCMFGQKIKQTFASELRFTSFGATWVFLFILPITTLFPSILECVCLYKLTTLGSISSNLCSTMGKFTTLFSLLWSLTRLVFSTTINYKIPCFFCSFDLYSWTTCNHKPQEVQFPIPNVNYWTPHLNNFDMHEFLIMWIPGSSLIPF